MGSPEGPQRTLPVATRGPPGSAYPLLVCPAVASGRGPTRHVGSCSVRMRSRRSSWPHSVHCSTMRARPVGSVRTVSMVAPRLVHFHECRMRVAGRGGQVARSQGSSSQ
jgi:hypothetical protein